MTAVSFPLDQTPEPATLTYRPWCTRTLKVRVSAANKTPALRIRPQAIRAEESAAGIFRAYADDSDAFIVSWGGGHEPGPCLKAEDYLLAFERCTGMEAGDSSLIYFNLTHVGPDVPDEATVTLLVYAQESGDSYATLTIRLQKPAAYDDDAVRFLPDRDGKWHLQGTRVATYDPRWWPRPIDYVPLVTPPLQVQAEAETLSVLWNDEIRATIRDHTRSAILTPAGTHLELFDFDQWHLALRAWFFWLDTRAGFGHEVPDAERFDMLLRKQDGFITLACTDLHWREIWYQIDGTPLRATVGLSRATRLKLMREGVDTIAALLRGEEEADHEGVYSPVDELIPRQARRLGQTPSFATRGKGLDSHVPNIENVVSQSAGTTLRMTSSDVRKG